MSRRDDLGQRAGATPTVDSVGLDEVGVVPWPIILRRRIASRLPFDPRWGVLWVALSGLFAVGFTITLLVNSLDDIADELGTSNQVLVWAITGPMLAFGVVGPAFGKAGDLWGHKRIFVSGLLLAGVFAVGTAVAWGPVSLVVFRILSATAGSACGPAAMAYINRLFDPTERVRPLSAWSFVTAGSPVLGVVLGGPLVGWIGWRAIFIIQAPLLLVGFVVAWWLLPGTERVHNVRFDVKGSVALGAAATLLLLSISRGNAWGWLSPLTLGTFALSIVAGVAFVAVERRAEAPLVVLQWFRTRNIALPVLCQALSNFAYMGGFIMIPLVLGRRGLGIDETTRGLLIISRPLAFALVAPLAALVTIKVGERVAGVAGSTAVVVSMLLWAQVGLDSGYLFIVVATAMSGIGLGISSPALTSLTANAVDERDLGVMGAMQQLATQLGAVLGSAVLTAMSAAAQAPDLGPFRVAFYAAAVVAVFGVVAAAFVRSTPR